MTNKEKYKQAFSAIHISDKFSLEVTKMTNTSHKQRLYRMLAGVAACVLLIGGSAAAYTSNLGGIQRTIQLWIQGDQTEVTIDFNTNGSYAIRYTDENGNAVEQGGGGVAIDSSGSERPLTEEELLEHLNSPEVVYEEDGSVWIYYYDQKIDITDRFEDNVCYVQVINGKATLYMTIAYQNGWTTSPDKYISRS